MPMPLGLRLVRIAAIATTTLGGIACSEPLAPSALAGKYALVAFNGLTPPQYASVNYTVIADTLDLATTGVGTWLAVYDLVRDNFPPQYGARNTVPVALVRRNGSLMLEVPGCTDTADCSIPAKLYRPVSVNGNRLSVRVSADVWTFQRIAP